MRIRIQLFTFIQGGWQTNADPDPYPFQILPPQKVRFWHENILYIGTVPVIRHKKYLLGYKSHFEMLEIGLNYFFPVSLLLDPNLHSQYWSGSRRAKWMQIRSTTFRAVAMRKAGRKFLTSVHPVHILARIVPTHSGRYKRDAICDFRRKLHMKSYYQTILRKLRS